MSAGTLTLTNNSALVAGSGTAFTTELAAGDFIVVTVGGVPYTLPVKSVESGTALTLVSNYTGPTQSGAAWSSVPRVALNMVTAALVTQSAEALRGLNYDKQNWQQVFSGTGTISVRLPDGTIFSGPAWNSITTALNQKASNGANNDITSLAGLKTPLSITQGGTGSNTASGARNKLELTSAAITEIGTEGDKIPLLSGLNTWSKLQTYTMGINTYTASGDTRADMKLMRDVGASLANSSGPAFNSEITTGVNSRCGAKFFSNFNAAAVRRAICQITNDGNVAATFAYDQSGTLTGPLGSAQWSGSDVQIKHDFMPAEPGHQERIAAIGIAEYKYNGTDVVSRGFLAQQMAFIDDRYVFPGGEALDENGETFEVLNVDNRAVIADLVSTVQDLMKEIAVLKKQVPLITTE
ncbi:hypothetical protein [Citrobacter braakii]|uniref:hypothetical protein n=1 Tax=Citrobacter braakii TaxID=57706 RepID=UPI0023B2ACFB|nr:hypothetical protein [Citrobacter braakii]MDE9582740.1 hypothetical protein [Citrobacter braakii]